VLTRSGLLLVAKLLGGSNRLVEPRLQALGKIRYFAAGLGQTCNLQVLVCKFASFKCATEKWVRLFDWDWPPRLKASAVIEAPASRSANCAPIAQQVSL
jgi:hypothetical protein